MRPSPCLTSTTSLPRFVPHISFCGPYYRPGCCLALGLYKAYMRTRLSYGTPAWLAPRYMRTISRDLRVYSLDGFVGRLSTKLFLRADGSQSHRLQEIVPYHRRPYLVSVTTIFGPSSISTGLSSTQAIDLEKLHRDPSWGLREEPRESISFLINHTCF